MKINTGFRMKQEVFTPFRALNRDYHLLFNRTIQAKEDLYVRDDPRIQQDTFFRVGSVHTGSYSGDLCGYAFYTTVSVKCFGVSLVAYSSQWKRRSPQVDQPGMRLILKSDLLYIYHMTNQATLVVCPTVSRKIRENLEV